jgi:hypothetical protein
MVSYYRKNVCNPIAAPYVDAEFNDWVKMAFVDKITPEYKMRVDERYAHKGPQYSKEHDGVRNIKECYYYLMNDDGKIGVDFVIEFDNLKSSFSVLVKKLGLNVNLPELTQMRSNVRTHNGKYFNIKTYHEMYDNESVDIIYNNFKNDIKMFGYEYE